MNAKSRIATTGVVVASLLSLAVAATAGVEEPLYVIDSPTGGLLAHGEYHAQGRFGPQTSILMGVRVGFRDFVHVGVSFGMQRVFERASPSVNDRVGFGLRLRLLQEGEGPALAIGFESQGVGAWDEELERYERKSKGFYLVLSRNWRFVTGQFSLHGGLNYSTETNDDEGLSGFAALDWEPVRGLAFLVDWDAALNDSSDDGLYGAGRTYLDAAVRATYGDNLTLMLVFRDLTGNFEPDDRVWREFEVAFVDVF